jgi:hypothetical protein
LFGLAVGLGLVGCGHPPPVINTATPSLLDSNIVATVNGAAISRQALQERLQRSGRALTPSAALEELIRAEAIYQKAVAAGFDRQPDVQARIKNLIVAQFREQQTRPTRSPPITEAELQAAYEAQKERFQTAEAVRGAMIFIEAPGTILPEKRAELRQRAETALAEAQAAADERAFAQVVARFSDDRPTRYRGGDTGWLKRDGASYDAVLTEALFQLEKPGAFGPLLEGPRGFYVARLLEKREAGSRPVGEVKEALRYQVGLGKAEQAERDFHASMKSGLDIQINHALIESLSTPAAAEEPPPLPRTTTAQLQ